MTRKTTKTASTLQLANPSPVAAATGGTVSTTANDTTTALHRAGNCPPQAAAVTAVTSERLRSRKVRNRNRPSAEPLAKFRATGDTPWKKAARNEAQALQLVGELGLLSTQQIADWVFKDLKSRAARLRQAQALTLRLCPAARAQSTSARLATGGKRPVVRAFGRKKVGNQHYYYLNARGMRVFLERYGLALPDAAKSLTTVVDMARRELMFEHLLTMHRLDPSLAIRGRSALAAEVAAGPDTEPFERTLLLCLSNLWCSRRDKGKVTYTYVADRAGSSAGFKLALYREIARAASLQLGQDIKIDIIGRRLPEEAATSLNETRLAKAVLSASEKETFWSAERRYETKKLVAVFSLLKPYAQRFSALMEKKRA